MKTAIKGKTALLCGLLILGLTLVGAGSALGAGTALQGEADVIKAWLVGDTIEISRNSDLIETVKLDDLDIEIVDASELPEGQETLGLNIDMDKLSDGKGIYIGAAVETVKLDDLDIEIVEVSELSEEHKKLGLNIDMSKLVDNDGVYTVPLDFFDEE